MTIAGPGRWPDRRGNLRSRGSLLHSVAGLAGVVLLAGTVAAAAHDLSPAPAEPRNVGPPEALQSIDLGKEIPGLAGRSPRMRKLTLMPGGDDVFASLAALKSARERIVGVDAVIAAAPDIIIGSWCGKKFRPDKVAARPRFDAIPAVRNQALHEIKSPLILQPGPAALTDGLDAITSVIDNWPGR